jgi:small subunit ribosomal protein S4e
MSRHLKRQKVPKNWPIPRKGTKYIIKPSFGLSNGVPLLVLLRDMLKIAQNRKEVKKVIHQKDILINGLPAKSEKTNVQLFDKITIVPSKTYYKLNLSSKGKFDIEKIKEPDANQKVAKIINKKILKGKKVQLNLNDGRNYLSDIKCNVNDSVSIDFKKKKIAKCLPLKENAKIIVIAGKHSGERGTLKKVKPERKMVTLNVGSKQVNILIKQVMVTG